MGIERDAEKMAALHNKMAGEIVAQIVKPTLQAGGEWADVLVLLESVIAGIILTAALPGSERQIFAALTSAVERRIDELKLENRPAAGRA